MTSRYEVTTAKIDYAGPIDLNLVANSAPLRKRLAEKGCDFDVVGTVEDDELQFISRSIIVTVRRDAVQHNRIRLSAASLIGSGHSRTLARDRFAACAAGVRHFIGNMPAERVTWMHKGRTYVTMAEETTTIEPKRVRRAVDRPVATGTRPAADTTALRKLAALADKPVYFGPEEADPLAGLRRDFCADAVPGTRVHARLDKDNVAMCGTTSNKVALYAMNSALMVVSMPVGAGVMTYNLLSGGSINATARAIGVTGAAMGLGGLTAQSAAASVITDALPGVQTLAGHASAIAGKLMPLAQSLPSLF